MQYSYMYIHGRMQSREVGRILRLGGQKKIFSRRGFFSRNFFDFLQRNPRISGYFEPWNNFWGQEWGTQNLLISYLYNFRGEAEQNIGGAMAPLAPPLTTSLVFISYSTYFYVVYIIHRNKQGSFSNVKITLPYKK